MARIKLNGESREIDDSLALSVLIEQLGLTGRKLAVLRNGEVVRKADHKSTVLAEGDTIDIVHMVGGG